MSWDANDKEYFWVWQQALVKQAGRQSGSLAGELESKRPSLGKAQENNWRIQ